MEWEIDLYYRRIYQSLRLPFVCQRYSDVHDFAKSHVFDSFGLQSLTPAEIESRAQFRTSAY